MPITPEIAKELLEADAANVIELVKAGQPLSARHLAAIENVARQAVEKPDKRKGKPGEIPTMADSIASACKLWGIDRVDIKRAKEGGCSAFRGSRVYRDTLIAWLKANPRSAEELAMDGKNLSLQDQKLAKQIEKLDIEIARSRGDLVERAIVTEEWGKHITRLFDIVNQSCSRDMALIITKEFRGYLGKAAKDL